MDVNSPNLAFEDALTYQLESWGYGQMKVQ